MFLYNRGRSAVLAVLDIALHQQGGPVGLSGICERTGLTLSYLENICRKLRHYGIVESVRGPQGGFLLAMPAGDVTVADVFRAVGELPMIRQRGRSKGTVKTMARRRTDRTANELWGTLEKRLIEYLSSITMKDLTMRKDPGKVGARVLEFPVQHRAAAAR